MNVDYGKEPIAIIGSGCRFPGGASSPSKLWDLLQKPRDVSRTIPDSRFNPDGFYHQDPQHLGRSNVREAYVLDENIRHFDAQFFNIKGVEASAIDPQHRVLLETTYEALEAAGLPIEDLRGSDTAVYVGLMYNDYELLQFRDLQSIPIYNETGTARSIASNRVSYFYDWHGPSITLDTACSSGLVAVHMAVQALRSGEAKVALAAGTNLLLGPEHFITESNLKMLSSDGQSRMWDDSVNGYGRGDGVAALVLKPLSSALADGDIIHSVIRETGVNHDGKTNGITMPSSEAQAALIKQTYAKAGLDIKSKSDRCQYFEAHGTGTPAGDPIEARAVYHAFFDAEGSEKSEKDPLWIGSIKSVIGHTESTAGIASVLKASLAMKHGYIPPNLHFNNLNPEIKPYYGPMQISKELRPWPKLAPGQPRRTSVNSFGFGGTNSHIIMEIFEPSRRAPSPSSTINSPFLFSAHSKQSLEDNFAELAAYLDKNPETNASDLAYTLRERRSQLPLRVALSATSIEELRHELTQPVAPEAVTSKQGDLKILGIFTGQGAQYMRMGAELLEGGDEQAHIVENMLGELDDSLATLPATDRPGWRIKDEILSSADSNRMNEATLSQPICTAIQIVLVQLLRRARVKLAAAVGHSSGEIGAAFAAGRLSAQDAIRVAYYRGFYGKLALSSGKKGSMMAAGLSWDDASDLCEEPQFEGRVTVAANNAPTSVTFSGDADAIQEMKAILEQDDTFHTELRVDTAYHSHHMTPCSGPYLKALAGCGIKVLPASQDCLWFSSVHANDCPNAQSHLDGPYWNDNLVSPVMFMDAVEAAINSTEFDAIVEIGPHPALKRPVLSTYDEVSSQGSEPVYIATLQRKQSARKSFSAALGRLWASLGDRAINIGSYERSMQTKWSFQVVPDLPSYRWSHGREYWHEAHASRNLRLRGQFAHALLGEAGPESSLHQLLWRHTLRIEDLPWIQDHRVQGSIVFPAAGFVATALETIPSIAKAVEYSMAEVEDFEILQPMVLGQEREVSIFIAVSDIDRQDPARITARFAYSSWQESSSDLRLMATAKISIVLGSSTDDGLPELVISKSNNIPVDADLFYRAAEGVGYGYTGFFRALSGTERKHGQASGLVEMPDDKSDDGPYLIHPASLDASLQVMLLAKSYPGDGELRSLYLPSSIRRVRINPKWCGAHWKAGETAAVRSVLTDSPKLGAIEGDISIMAHGQGFTSVQLEGVTLQPLKRLTAGDDRHLFSSVDWVVGNPDLALLPERPVPEEARHETSTMERAAAFYLSQLVKRFPPGHAVRKGSEHYRRYLRWADVIVDKVARGKHAYVKPDQLPGSWDEAVASYKQFADYPVFKLFDTAAHYMPEAIRGEASMVEKLVSTPEWVEYYEVSVGPKQAAEQMGDAVAQIIDRYPRAKMLEVGAGTGGATKMIFGRIGRNFGSYDYTDISAGFFGEAKNSFQPYVDKMNFEVLNLDHDLDVTRFAPGTYDIVVASLVIHATGNVEGTLRKLRTLLKPGGYLVMVEAVNPEAIYPTFIFGCLEGWWLEGREMGAPTPVDEWHEMLLCAGYSGVDSSTPDDEALVFPYQVLVSQAMDDKMTFIRDPLSLPESLFHGKPAIQDLFIIGGATSRVAQLAERVKELLLPASDSITTFRSLEAVDTAKVTSKSTVLVLEELDHPVFEGLNANCFNTIKHLLSSKKDVLWATENRLTSNPYGNMIIGLERSITWEVPDLRVRFVDFDDVKEPSGRLLAESVLRLHVAEPWMADESLTWTAETETIYKANGTMLIPRMRRFPEADNRLNSASRAVTKHVDPSRAIVALTESGGETVLAETQQEDMSPDAAGIELQLSHSSSYAIRSGSNFLYVALGTSVNSGSRYVGFTASPASIVKLPGNSVVPCPVPAGEEGIMLGLVVLHLVASSMLCGINKGDKMLVHDATPMLANVLEAGAKKKGAHITYTTTSSSNVSRLGWTHIHPRIAQSQLKRMLPRNIAKFVDLTPGRGSPIGTALEGRFTYEDIDSLFQASGSVNTTVDVSSLLKEVDLFVYKSVESQPVAPTLTVSIDQLSSQRPVWAVLEWNKEPAYEVAVRPLEVRLRSDRTYWLCGLTGSLGLSTADWMISKGARHVVLSSRSPKIDPVWLEEAKAEGVEVRVAACNVSDFDSLNRLYQDITKTMPAIAGVAHGAMVLKDMPIWDTTFEEARGVFGPKVDGSIHLDRLFHDTPLDFFIFFGSSTGALGNPGQALYTASNHFLSGLVRQRRLRGVAASSMGLAIVLGVGYATEQLTSTSVSRLKKRGFDVLSEAEFHQVLGETIVASPAQAPGTGEIWSGLNLASDKLDGQIPWHSNPQFGFLIGSSDAAAGHKSAQGKTVVSIKQQLLGATTLQAVEAIVFDTLTQETRTLLGLSDDQELKNTTRTDELGVDSLVAVKLRTWLLSNYAVSIPTLEILGGTSLGQLCQKVMVALPESLAPNMDRTASSSEQGGSATPSSGTDVSADTAVSIVDDKSEGEKVPERAPVVRTAPISFTQAMFWFVHALLLDKSALNNTCCFDMKGPLRKNDLARAVQVLAQRHESLRTCFELTEDQGVIQAVLETSSLALECHDIDSAEDVSRCFDELHNHEFDLQFGSTIRMVLLTRSAHEHYIILGYHHIIFDGASHVPLMHELDRAYNWEPSPHDVMQFVDFSNTQLQKVNDGSWDGKLAFWREQFKTILEVLPIHRARVPERQLLSLYDNSTREGYDLAPDLQQKLGAFARANRTTPLHVYLAAFKILLFRFLGVTDVCVGLADDGRRGDGLEHVIGPFLNILPIRMPAKPTETFSRAAKIARDQTMAALENSEVPVEAIFNHLRVKRSPTHSPLFQTLVNYLPFGVQGMDNFCGGQLQLQEETMRTALLPFDMTLTIFYAPERTQINFNTQSHLYSQEDCALLLRGYQDILQEIADTPKAKIGSEFKFRQEDLQKAVQIGRAPTFESRFKETLSHHIESLVPTFGDKPALMDDSGNVRSYSGLANRMSSICEHLLSLDIRPGAQIAVFQQPSVSWIESFLAILKLGAVYSPLDPSTPPERLSMIVHDAQPAAILVDAETAGLVGGLKAPPHTKIIDVSKLRDMPTKQVPTYATADALAIVIYTSGSTGTPKGVRLTHSNLKYAFDRTMHDVGPKRDDIVLQQTAYSFDLSIMQIFMTLTVGATLCVATSETRQDARLVVQLIQEKNITTTLATPTEYKGWLRRENWPSLRRSAWKVAMSSGEAVTESQVRLFQEADIPELVLYNSYGPTETSCASSGAVIPYRGVELDGAVFPAGTPYPNESIYILDDKQNMLPLGIPGEVCIGGSGVAAGYLNRPEQTGKAFLPDPFASPEYHKMGWTTMYRTGDRGRLLEDGTLVVQGRIEGDVEVKISGFRIDLRDVEQTILRTAKGHLNDAVASVRKTSGGDDSTKYMLAHVTFSDLNPSLDRVVFLRELCQTLPLPRQMRPAAIVMVESLPVTVSGKIDRKAVTSLPGPSVSADQDHGDLSERELSMLGLWKKVIPEEVSQMISIGRDSEFFTAGGSSILLMQLHGLIRERSGKEIPLILLYQAITLSAMAELLGDDPLPVTARQYDWSAEASVQDDIPAATEPQVQSPPRVVVLTGSTGFLGQYLLQSLVCQEHIEQVICLGLRPGSAEKRTLLEANKKITCYAGDLIQPRLGLDETTALDIFGKADAVIHNGAAVSHLQVYQSLKTANVESTRELVALCLPRLIPFHYVSTTGVANYTTEPEIEEASVRCYPPPPDGAYGYLATKFVSEMYLENVHEKRGLPVWIHRPSSIVRPESGGLLGTTEVTDTVQNMLGFSYRIKTVPKATSLRGYLNFVYPESVADAIVSDVNSGGAMGRCIIYRHEAGDEEVDVSDLKEFMEKKAGERFREVPMEEWIAKARVAGLPKAMVAIFSAFVQVDDMNFPRVLRRGQSSRKNEG